MVVWLSGSALISVNDVALGPVSTGMGDRLRVDKPSLYVTSHGLGYTLQYCSQDNSRASTDRELLTCYIYLFIMPEGSA